MLNDFAAELAPLVTRIRETFPWYDRLVSECGYDLDGDPERLPYIDEAILTQHYYTAAHNGLEGAHTYLTSGTSNGARKKTTMLDERDEQGEQFEKMGRDIREVLQSVEDALIDAGDTVISW